VAAGTIVLLAFASAFGVAVAQERFAERLQAAAPTMKRLGGIVLIVVGTWFIALGVFADAFARVFPV
jgi:TRAP-type C4-dicarboxylate transport system permease large subunit